MNINQKNKLSMFLAVLGVLEKYKTTWMPLTAFAALVQSLKDLTAAIQEASGIQGTPSTGITGGKNRKQVFMCERMMEIVDDMHTVAQNEKDDELAGKTDLELSDLLRMDDVLVGPFCRQLYDLCLPRAADLVGLGTTAQDFTDLDEAIEAYLPLATAPRQAIVGKAGVTGNIDLDTKSGMKLLNKQIDKAMRKFQRKQPEFFNAYTSARIIVDLGGGQADKAEEKPTDSTPPVG